MTTQAVSIELEPRETTGKKVKALRRDGTLPVHLYGRGVESRSLQCDTRTLLRAISRAGGEYSGQTMSVSIAGESSTYNVEVSEIQWDPRNGDVLHVDLRTVSS